MANLGKMLAALPDMTDEEVQEISQKLADQLGEPPEGVFNIPMQPGANPPMWQPGWQPPTPEPGMAELLAGVGQGQGQDNMAQLMQAAQAFSSLGQPEQANPVPQSPVRVGQTAPAQNLIQGMYPQGNVVQPLQGPPGVPTLAQLMQGVNRGTQ